MTKSVLHMDRIIFRDRLIKIPRSNLEFIDLMENSCWFLNERFIFPSSSLKHSNLRKEDKTFLTSVGIFESVMARHSFGLDFSVDDNDCYRDEVLPLSKDPIFREFSSFTQGSDDLYVIGKNGSDGPVCLTREGKLVTLYRNLPGCIVPFAKSLKQLVFFIELFNIALDEPDEPDDDPNLQVGYCGAFMGLPRCEIVALSETLNFLGSTHQITPDFWSYLLCAFAPHRPNEFFEDLQFFSEIYGKFVEVRV